MYGNSKKGGKGETKRKTFDQYEEDVRGKKKGKASGSTPSIIQVQRMKLNQSKKKYVSEEVRENVDFSGYEEISIGNIQRACEAAFNYPSGSCEILVTTNGPVAIQEWQILKKSFYYIHFKSPTNADDEQQSCSESMLKPDCRRPTLTAGKPIRKPEPSVSIVDMIRASKLKKPAKTSNHTISMERFLIGNGGSWDTEQNIEIVVEDEQTDDGGFRNCFNCFIGKDRWMMKRLKPHRVDEAQVVKLTDEDHTRKQVQMHAVAKVLVEKFNQKCPEKFGKTFSYEDVYFTMVDGRPATLERYVDGQCFKYVNNNGICPAPEEGMEDLFEKGQALAHFSWVFSDKKLLLLDIQGSGYCLYDPEIATPNLVTTADEEVQTDMIEFCMGNMSLDAIKLFMNREHKCGKFCEMLGLDDQTND